MIVVTGTKRSGTSLWMQILKAAGFDVIGTAFPAGWGEALRPANPRGFFESALVAGIYFRTNPDPATNEYLFPEETADFAVKIFIPGLLRTELAFLARVIVTIRPWQEHVASWQKFQRLADANGVSTHPLGEQAARLHPALEWWLDYHSLIRDVAIRRYPIHIQAYPLLLEQAERILSQTFEWLGGGNLLAALDVIDAALKHEHATMPCADVPDIPPACLDTFDRLYMTIANEMPLSDDFVEELNLCHKRLRPVFLGHQAAVQSDLLQSITTVG